jgi:hypothetical protein
MTLRGGVAWAGVGHDQALRANLTGRRYARHHLVIIYSANARTRRYDRLRRPWRNGRPIAAYRPLSADSGLRDSGGTCILRSRGPTAFTDPWPPKIDPHPRVPAHTLPAGGPPPLGHATAGPRQGPGSDGAAPHAAIVASLNDKLDRDCYT